MELDTYLVLGALAAMGSLSGVVEGLKVLGMPSRYAPMTSIILGVGIGVGVTQAIGDLHWMYGALLGYGLSGTTSFSYDQIKNYLKK